jgi:hypothetical protein
LAELLQKLHKPVTPLGFGLPGTAVARRKPLILLGFNSDVDATMLREAVPLVDAAVLMASAPSLKPEPVEALPTGVYVAESCGMPSLESLSWCDFVWCDMDGPAEVGGLEGKELMVTVQPGQDASLLRAIADTGADALVLDTTQLEMRRLSTVVECRRTYVASGKPLMLQLDAPLSAGEFAGLWRAGVDGFIVDAGCGVDRLREIRCVIDEIDFRPRGGGGPVAVIGAHVMGHSNLGEPDEEDDDDGADDDD